MMSKRVLFLFLGIIAIFVVACQVTMVDEAPAAEPAAEPLIDERTGIAFPTGYDTTFENYLSLDRTQLNHGQTIRLLANDIAMQGPDENGHLAMGSVLVAEVYKALKDENGEVMVSSLGRQIQGDLALIAVMERGEGFGSDLPEGLKNEQWDFATFTPDGMGVAEKDLNSCRACHAPLANTHHLFSYEHIANEIEPVNAVIFPDAAAAEEEGAAEMAVEVPEGAVVLDVAATDALRFGTDALEVASGSTVSLNFANNGTLEHSFALMPAGTDPMAINADDALNGANTGQLSGGESKTINFDVPAELGEYMYVCTVPGHAAAGMVGTLTVTE